MNRLTAACLIALTASSFAFAGDDDDEDVNAAMGAAAGPAGINLNINIKDGSKKKSSSSVQVEAKSHEEITSNKPGEAFKLTYDSTENGSTSFKVLSPEGYLVRAYDSGTQMAADTIPMSFNAWPGKFYLIEIVSRDGVIFSKKFEAKGGMVAALSVRAGGPKSTVVVVQQAPAAPAAPACMGSGDLGSIKEAIEGESFSEQKVAVLDSAMNGRSLCAAQAIDLLNLYTFSKDKLDALRLMKPHIADPQNNFKIISAFTFDGDKKQAKSILSN